MSHTHTHTQKLLPATLQPMFDILQLLPTLHFAFPGYLLSLQQDKASGPCSPSQEANIKNNNDQALCTQPCLF